MWDERLEPLVEMARGEAGYPAEEAGCPPLALIVACGVGGVIGKAGGMPWHEPLDLRFFRRVTLHHAVIMGRKTFDSIGKPLPERSNLVVTRQAVWDDGGMDGRGVEWAGSFEAALQAARQRDLCPMVIGGASLYASALPLATRLFITQIGYPVEGDTFFPAWDRRAWSLRASEEIEGRGGRLRFEIWARG
jgi:dihydrofolate reductase